MKSWEKTVKYLAIALAVALIALIIFVSIQFLYALGIIKAKEGQLKDFRTYSVDMDVKYLDIDLETADLEIKIGDEFAIKSNDEDINIVIKNNKILIQEKGFKFFRINKSSKVIVQIPTNIEFDIVEIDSGISGLNINSLLTKKIDLDLGVGKVYLSNIKVSEKASIDSGVGKLSLEDVEFNNLDLNSGIGEIEFKGVLAGENDIELGIGGASLIFLDSKDKYHFNIDKGLGSIEYDGSKVDGSLSIGSGDTKVDLESGIGSLSIDFIGR